MEVFNFRITKKDEKTRARLGVISTANGKIFTPEFVPVATSATIKGITTKQLEEIGAQCALANTYHLHLKPGDKLVKKLGGLHKFMNFEKPLFTDSGGFQAFSLGANMAVGKLGSIREKKADDVCYAKVSDKGVKFKSVYDGTKHFMDSKSSMKIQSNLGANIIMAFDECTSPHHDKKYQIKALERTEEWAKKSLKHKDKKQALYGIIQGGQHKDLRIRSAKFTNSLPFEGIAIGGSFGNSYGDSKKRMLEVLDWISPFVDERPKHMLGIGGIDDIFECVERGMDTFDCVHPTRIARRGNLYISPKVGGKLKNKHRIAIKNSKFRKDTKPIDPTCECPTCKNYSRAYLRHLFVNKEPTYAQLAILHNLYFILNFMKEIRNSLKEGTFEEMKKKWLK